ncbi:excinuclease ABC subunit UvrC [Oceanibaculum pacificum]|uniref:excinuclease ABC subunit UvrC n=1 Tax=Oceanibaculum pacificum TaxID=580166 RepID=UPI000AA98251|nr:excinuclease ABC subunit UvrC [Oceanibaculum pacificum]
MGLSDDRLEEPADDDAESAGRKRGGPVSLAAGIAVLKAKLRTLPNAPGVYRMLDKRGDALYVGKARSLKKRVVAYTQPERLPYRLQRMVAETVTLEVVRTHTEVEALLLESNYIKRFMPRYNVLLRDDKSFPYILITGDHDFPQVVKHRGARGRPGHYFGPFASAGAVKQTLTALQRAFLLRNCTDAMFSSRTRPCLQYQIKRCTAPCVDYVTKEQYGEQVREARDFFSGKSRQIQQMMVDQMQAASEALDFEAAALFRDRIRGLSHIQSHQDINVAGLEDADIVAAHQEGGATCIQVFFFRGGRNYGNRAYFPSHEKNLELEAVLASFLGQFYDNKTPPRTILLSHAPEEQELLAEALSISAGVRVELSVPQRGPKRKVVEHAVSNAREALGRRLAESSSQRKLLDGVAAAFGIEGPLDRVEVYDNSHIQGTNAIGAMIVAGPDGLMKNAYRKFNIRATEVAGDDYGMMREVLTRRFARALKEDPDRETNAWPDLVLIDGGLGQLGIAVEVLAELGIGDVPLVSIAKGPDRNAGRERFFMPDREPFSLEPRDPVLYFLQRLRDEAHRFAIETHRAKRAKAMGVSSLDGVPGIGAKRKKALLLHFGSARSVERAGLTDLENVDGISKTVAKKIYDHFHDEG